VKKSKPPSREECFELLKLYCVPRNIVNHSLTVAKVAVFLGKALRQKGLQVDVDLLDRAALLHDIARVCDFDKTNYRLLGQDVTEKDKAVWAELVSKYKGLCHEFAAYEILKEKYPVVAEVIKAHRYMGMLDERDRPKSWEQKLLFYADMRVMHDKIVPLKKRLEDGHKRNVHFHGSAEQSRINTAKVDPLIFEQEKQIFEKLDFEPDNLTGKFIDTDSNGI
jgi:putative nucleotidyltransferase with HDIG domain